MLNGTELNLLFSQVFGYSSQESGHRMGFLVDVPSLASEDTPQWQARRRLVMRWARTLARVSFHACMVYAFESVGRAGTDFIHSLHFVALSDEVPDTADELSHYRGAIAEAEEVYTRAEFWIALTQHSVSAPLKNAAIRSGFRAVTLSGLVESMFPALSVDLLSIESRVTKLASALTMAGLARLEFDVRGERYELVFDLRYRMGFAHTGRYAENTQVGSLPAGEAYIVPYEGEKIGIISMTEGILPIEKDGEIALCEISENRVVCIDGDNAFAESLRKSMMMDRMRTNVAELGLGILSEWGIEPTGLMQLDEKLGVHVAFGRSENIGGVTSPSDFKSPATVSHTDFVFHRSLMPDIHIVRGALHGDGRVKVFMSNDKYMWDML